MAPFQIIAGLTFKLRVVQQFCQTFFPPNLPQKPYFTRYETFNISFFDLVTNSAVKKIQIL
jgi:hypothetical protein